MNLEQDTWLTAILLLHLFLLFCQCLRSVSQHRPRRAITWRSSRRNTASDKHVEWLFAPETACIVMISLQTLDPFSFFSGKLAFCKNGKKKASIKTEIIVLFQMVWGCRVPIPKWVVWEANCYVRKDAVEPSTCDSMTSRKSKGVLLISEQ